MGIRIGKKKFLHFIDIEKGIKDGRDVELHCKMSGLSEKEVFYIWRHYGKLYAKYVEGYKDA